MAVNFCILETLLLVAPPTYGTYPSSLLTLQKLTTIYKTDNISLVILIPDYLLTSRYHVLFFTSLHFSFCIMG